MALTLDKLRFMRERGWMVAAHNDYHKDGEFWTFWLFVKGNRAVKGEGKTDFEALCIAEDESFKPAKPEPEDGG
ncbi:MAG: hypothetical protein V3S55_06175 [Nitrospiraceae bacterium]